MGFQALTFDGVNTATTAVAKALLSHGDISSPRGLETTELRNVLLQINNPRARLSTIPVRGWSFPLAVGELCWHASASDSVDALAYYAPRWKQFSEDGLRIRGSCYGKKIFGRGDAAASQWDLVQSILQHDPESRRAVLRLDEGVQAASTTSLDVSCTVAMQFLVREGKLDATVYMRSNDIIWGFPYDVFLFSFLQELLAASMGLQLGSYAHFAASLHVYERHYPLLQRIADANFVDEEPMLRMETSADLVKLIEFENNIRMGQVDERLRGAMSPYWRRLADVLSDYARDREMRAAVG